MLIQRIQVKQVVRLIVFLVLLIMVFNTFQVRIQAQQNKETSQVHRSIDVDELMGDFVNILPGNFILGATERIEIEKGEFNDRDMPAHKVFISKEYEIGKYEVTQQQWEAVMGENPSYFIGELLPVEQINWQDAQEFIKKLNSKTDKYIYRLPTEAEWEYAAKAGNKDDSLEKLDLIAWSEENAGGKTHRVGTKKPNTWGLYDMQGNVSEWCQDWYEKYKPDFATDPKGPSKGNGRVGRGGSWYNPVHYCRSTSRYQFAAFARAFCVGVRLVRQIK